MRSAQPRSRSATSGSQMKTFSRLAVRDTPVGSNGPTISMPPITRGTRI